uniref:DUF1725 domain-containing protein n=1 Tax=Sus scrofa TaxID=9823 RepID=A0A8D0MRY1_PIG
SSATQQDPIANPSRRQHSASIYPKLPVPPSPSHSLLFPLGNHKSILQVHDFLFCVKFPRRNQPKSPLIDDWIRKMWFIYTMEYYSAITKNKIMPFAATWMELETLILSEVNQKEKDKYHMISLISQI